MIFAETWHLILTGRKSQTLRLADPGDALTEFVRRIGEDFVPHRRVVTESGRCRWRVGGEYAVQRERCHPAVGRVLCTSLTDVPDPLAVLDDGFARAEGFDGMPEFLAVWRKLHEGEPNRRCWAIGFRLLSYDPGAAREAERKLAEGMVPS